MCGRICSLIFNAFLSAAVTILSWKCSKCESWNGESQTACSVCAKREEEELAARAQIDWIAFRDVCRDVLGPTNLDISLSEAVKVIREKEREREQEKEKYRDFGVCFAWVFVFALANEKQLDHR